MTNPQARHDQHELVKREFDRAKAYADEYAGRDAQAHFFNIRIKRVSELLAGFHQGKVLDVGCGPAVVGRLFGGQPIEYHGVDLSEAMIKVAREGFGADPRFTFSIQEIERLGFPDACFDVVLCLGVLEYVLNEPAAIGEVARVLRPGGTLIVTMLNSSSPYEIYDHYIHGKMSSAIRKLAHLLEVGGHGKDEKSGARPKRPLLTLLKEKSLSRLLASQGLEVQDSLYYDFHVIPPPWDSLFPKASVSLSGHLEFLCRGPLRFLGRGYMISCRKPAAGAPKGKLESAPT